MSSDPQTSVCRSSPPGVLSWFAGGILTAALTFPIWAMTPRDFDKFGAVKFEAVVLVAALALALMGMEGIRIRSFGLKATAALVLVGMLVLHSLLAALFSANPVTGVMGNNMRYDGFYMIAGNAVLFALAYRLSADSGPPALSRMARVLVLAALPVWGYGFLQLAGHDPFLWQSFRGAGGRIFSTLGNPIFLGGYTAMVVPVAVGLAVGLRGFARWGWIAAAGIGTAALVFTAARAGWLGLAVGIVLMAAFALRWSCGRKTFRVLVAVGVIAGAVVFVGLNISPSERQGARLESRAVSITTPGGSLDEGRLAIWDISLAMIADHTVFGVELDEMGEQFEKYRTAAFDRAEGADKKADKPHSSALEWAVETGIPGAVLFVCLVGVILGGGLMWLWHGGPGGRDNFQMDQSSSRSQAVLERGERWEFLGLVSGATAYLAQSLVTVTAIGVDGVWWIILGLVAGLGLWSEYGLAEHHVSIRGIRRRFAGVAQVKGKDEAC